MVTGPWTWKSSLVNTWLSLRCHCVSSHLYPLISPIRLYKPFLSVPLMRWPLSPSTGMGHLPQLSPGTLSTPAPAPWLFLKLLWQLHWVASFEAILQPSGWNCATSVVVNPERPFLAEKWPVFATPSFLLVHWVYLVHWPEHGAPDVSRCAWIDDPALDLKKSTRCPQAQFPSM